VRQYGNDRPLCREAMKDSLARWMITNWSTKRKRQESLARIEKHHGSVFVDDLKRRITLEWRSRG